MPCCNADSVQLVQNDSRPTLQLLVYDANTEDVYDLSDAGTQVYFVLKAVGAKTAKEAILCQKLPGVVADDGTVSYPPGYSVPGSGGRVEVQWTDTALDTAGTFDGKLQVYFGDGTLQTSFEGVKLVVAPQWGGLPMPPEPLPS